MLLELITMMNMENDNSLRTKAKKKAIEWVENMGKGKGKCGVESCVESNIRVNFFSCELGIQVIVGNWCFHFLFHL